MGDCLWLGGSLGGGEGVKSPWLECTAAGMHVYHHTAEYVRTAHRFWNRNLASQSCVTQQWESDSFCHFLLPPSVSPLLEHLCAASPLTLNRHRLIYYLRLGLCLIYQRELTMWWGRCTQWTAKVWKLSDLSLREGIIESFVLTLKLLN